MEKEREFTQACCDHFRTRDSLDGYLALYAEDALLWGYGPEPIRGRVAIRAFYEGILEAFGDVRLVLDEVLSDPIRACLTLRFHMDCRHVGPFLGVPPTDRMATLQGITILRFEGGRCVERWSTADFLGLLGQLGAFPPS